VAAAAATPRPASSRSLRSRSSSVGGKAASGGTGGAVNCHQTRGATHGPPATTRTASSAHSVGGRRRLGRLKPSGLHRAPGGSGGASGDGGHRHRHQRIEHLGGPATHPPRGGCARQRHRGRNRSAAAAAARAARHIFLPRRSDFLSLSLSAAMAAAAAGGGNRPRVDNYAAIITHGNGRLGKSSAQRASAGGGRQRRPIAGSFGIGATPHPTRRSPSAANGWARRATGGLVTVKQFCRRQTINGPYRGQFPNRHPSRRASAVRRAGHRRARPSPVAASTDGLRHRRARRPRAASPVTAARSMSPTRGHDHDQRRQLDRQSFAPERGAAGGGSAGSCARPSPSSPVFHRRARPARERQKATTSTVINSGHHRHRRQTIRSAIFRAERGAVAAA